ncbi:CHAT domain-containing protein [Streptomyces sp. NRRL S-87]|uniref:CHAT domain-containing protein n=1 Tax=Streptomyces sp. NRRL S-87 TaxID=1463920 RepID=UPI0004BF89BA|nr:CHAT domain-containing protein [Streptomyces sp. NRRL S-87]
MTGSQPADVTVRVRRTARTTQVVFQARNGTPPLRMTLPQPGVMDVARRRLDAGLLGLKDVLPGLAVDDGDVPEVFDVLHRIGRGLVFLLFGLEAGVIQGLQAFWNAALPVGRNPALPPPLVECVGDRDCFLPLELLPLHRMYPTVPADRAELVAQCRDLVGFSCVVKRTLLPARVPTGLSLRPAPGGRLPLRFLRHELLSGARRELDWLTSAAADRVEVDGPYPGDGDDTGAATLAEQIFDPRRSLAGEVRAVPDQIQHFACHCYATLDSPLDNEIELHGGGRDLRVKLGTIAEDLVALKSRPGHESDEMPLVVMNACGSARMHATSSLSFPHLFLTNGNRGFVGSEIEVPDEVAAAFSQALYERFLLRRLPLGRSVFEARNSLLHTYGNPLGIAYAAYADPQLHVRTDPTEDADVDLPANRVPAP